MARKGIALVLSAPSGTGKTTLIHKLLGEFPDIKYSISCTTRKPRQGEVNGKDYHFMSVRDFLLQRDAGAFAEWALVHGNYYATPLKPLQENLNRGVDVLFDIDVQGASQLKLNVLTAAFIFILPPSMKELEQRLRARGTESEEDIQARLHNAHDEIKEACWYDAVVINDDLEVAYSQLRAAYLAATLAPACHPALISSLLHSGEN